MEGAGSLSCTGATVRDQTGKAGQGCAVRTCYLGLCPQLVGSRLPGCCCRGETHFTDEIVEVSEAPLANPHSGQLDLRPPRPPFLPHLCIPRGIVFLLQKSLLIFTAITLELNT